jgi:hypothetical protein
VNNRSDQERYFDFHALVVIYDQQFRCTIHKTATAIISPPAGNRAMTFHKLFNRMKPGDLSLEQESAGQGLVEYALIIFLVSVASLVAVGALGVGVKTQLYDVILALLPF